MFVEAPESLAEMDAIATALSGVVLAATRAMQGATEILMASGTMRETLHQLTAFDDFNALVGLPEHLAAEVDFES